MNQNDNVMPNRSTTWSLSSLPCPINGVALSCVGIAVMWTKLATIYDFRTPRMMAAMFGLTIYASCLVMTYIARIINDPYSWFERDYSSPEKIFRMGIMSNAICLIALMLSCDELRFPESVPLAITLCGLCIQIPSMIWFIYKCVNTRCWPEPFYNAALQSCIFPVISLPGSSSGMFILRRLLLGIGMATLIPSSLIQMYRVLIPRKTEQEIVANNPSVCIMQTGWSITLIAWLSHPLTETAVSGLGMHIANMIFSISILVDVLTWVAMWQRRKALQSFGVNNPVWAAVSFPFASSSIAAIMYNYFLGSHLTSYVRYLIVGWIIFLSVVASILVIAINGIFIKNYYFLRQEIPVRGSSASSEDIGAVNINSYCDSIISLDAIRMDTYTRDLVV